MRKKLLAIISTALLTLSLFSCGINKDENINVIEEQDTNVSINLKDSFIYIDNKNSLSIKDKFSESSYVLKENVIDFKNSNDYIAFINKDSNWKQLNLYDIKENSFFTVKEFYKDDFLINDKFLFYIDSLSVYKMDLVSKEKTVLCKIGTDDVVLNYADNDYVMFSYISNSIPTTFLFNLKTEEIKAITYNAMNLMILGNYVYGLDSSSNIFRISLETFDKETVSDFPVLKFCITDKYLTYIDYQGYLRTLDYNGINRVISESSNDFVVLDNKLYYTSFTNKDYIFETQPTGNPKKILIKNSYNILKLNFIK